MKKIDFKKELDSYKAKAKPVIIDIPAMQYLMIDGKGDPNTSADYKHAVEALFTVSYTLKFMIKKGEAAIDYGVAPLEGLWWSDNIEDFVTGNKENWDWTMMIMQPEYITADLFKEATAMAGKKKDLPALPLLRLQTYNEGLCGQVLHTGPFSDEGPVIQRLHDYIIAEEYELTGKHHEIYLNDFRKVAPAKMKTIIRQPAKPA